jgi:hypothetical protein
MWGASAGGAARAAWAGLGRRRRPALWGASAAGAARAAWAGLKRQARTAP